MRCSAPNIAQRYGIHAKITSTFIIVVFAVLLAITARPGLAVAQNSPTDTHTHFLIGAGVSTHPGANQGSDIGGGIGVQHAQ